MAVSRSQMIDDAVEVRDMARDVERSRRRRWIECRPGFFLPVHVLSRRKRSPGAILAAHGVEVVAVGHG
ncbi:hypothetical protein [Methylosinus sporium]|uniref:hypothetical protein n=1 Tax=Methylosinus sporium TaxID=428 RepID=UPI001FCF0D58|nr:hypothetical protein [Methylosinus sporium]